VTAMEPLISPQRLAELGLTTFVPGDVVRIEIPTTKGERRRGLGDWRARGPVRRLEFREHSAALGRPRWVELSMARGRPSA